MFRRASESILGERAYRQGLRDKLMRFGVDSIDDAMLGILPEDLILVGAPSGVGKTQLCCNIALANIGDGKKVHYIALEAAEFEIEQRLKYPLIMERYYSDPHRPRIEGLTFSGWMTGLYDDQLDVYESDAQNYFEKAYRDLFIFSKGDRFGISQLIESISYASSETDLIIVDHVHYFDFDDENENRAMKAIAKAARDLVLIHQKPIILVAHLRKKDRGNDSLVADMDEFHGSSDLYKIASRVITFAPGSMTESGHYETFFRLPKNRLDGGVTRFCFRELFDPKTGGYKDATYKIGWANQSKSAGFGELDRSHYPDWAKRSYARNGGNSPDAPPRQSRPYKD